MSTQTPEALDDQVKQAEVMFAQGEVDPAFLLLSQVVEVNPNHARAWNDLGTVCYTRGALDYAAQFYHRALDLEPENLVCRTNLVTLLLDRGQLVPAREVLAAGALIYPRDAALAQLEQELERREQIDGVLFSVADVLEPIPHAEPGATSADAA